MQTQCSSAQLHFQGLGAREVVADFQGGTITSDAGALLLRQVDLSKRYLEDFANCFRDERDARYVEHSLPTMLRQRVLALCLGYEDLNDHDRLRQDPLFATACGVLDPTGRERKYARDQGKALAGKSTLNRLETTPPGTLQPRSKKIIYDPQAIESYFVQKFLQSRRSAPRRLILDLDCTDTILHGHQQGRKPLAGSRPRAVRPDGLRGHSQHRHPGGAGAGASAGAGLRGRRLAGRDDD